MVATCSDRIYALADHISFLVSKKPSKKHRMAVVVWSSTSGKKVGPLVRSRRYVSTAYELRIELLTDLLSIVSESPYSNMAPATVSTAAVLADHFSSGVQCS